MKDEQRSYTLKECEGIFHVTRVTLLTWIKNGKLPAVKVGKKWLVSEQTVKAMLNEE